MVLCCVLLSIIDYVESSTESNISQGLPPIIVTNLYLYLSDYMLNSFPIYQRTQYPSMILSKIMVI